MLDQGAGGRHEYGLVAVYPPHQIRGRAIGAMNLGDDTFPVSVARVTAPDHDLISHFRAHFFPPYHRCRQPDLRTDGQTGPKVRTGRASSWRSAPDVHRAKTARSGTATAHGLQHGDRARELARGDEGVPEVPPGREHVAVIRTEGTGRRIGTGAPSSVAHARRLPPLVPVFPCKV